MLHKFSLLLNTFPRQPIWLRSHLKILLHFNHRYASTNTANLTMQNLLNQRKTETQF